MSVIRVKKNSPFPLPWEELQAAVQNEIQPAYDAVFRQVEGTDGKRGLLVYLHGVIDEARIDDHLISPFQQQALADIRKGSVLNAQPIGLFNKAIQQIFLGSAVLFVEDKEEAYAFAVGGGESRSIKEPETEAVIRGPREGFIERIDANIALIRNIISSPDLKFESFDIGTSEPTKIVLAYHNSIAKKCFVNEARKRLKAIKIDSVLESGSVQEFIEDRPRSPFPQLIYTERPDSVAGHLLEGRFAVLTDGTPFALIGPVTFWQMFHSSEDYYEKFVFSSFFI